MIVGSDGATVGWAPVTALLGSIPTVVVRDARCDVLVV